LGGLQIGLRMPADEPTKASSMPMLLHCNRPAKAGLLQH
jgi:hypothetical protein